MFSIDHQSRQPIYEQIISQMELFVLSSAVLPGEKLPSLRNISQKAAINPNTVQKAFTELERKGIITTIPAKGCFIAEDAKEIIKSIKFNELERISEICITLRKAGMEKQIIFDKINKIYDGEEL